MRKWKFALLLLTFTLGLPLLGAWVGHRLTYVHLRKRPWEVNDLVRRRVEEQRQKETLAGCFAVNNLPLDGLERCYYSSAIDFQRITWVGPDMPTPFVGFAPRPGPLASGSINSMQFRYGREIEVPKPAHVYRIFLVGGSVAYGAGATSDETTVGGYLEKYLNEQADQFGRRFEVITAATGAWTSTHERILVENRLVELEPDLVISLSGHNDVHWAGADRNVLWFRAFSDDYYFTLANSLLACNFGQEFPADPPGAGPVSGAQARDRLVRNVMLTHAALQTVGAEYVYALQPVLPCSRKPRTPRERTMEEKLAANADGFRDHFARFRQGLSGISLPGYHFVDLTPLFDDAGPTDFFIDNCHFGDRGHDRIAQVLRDRLTPLLKARMRN